MQGTAGAALHPGLDTRRVNLILRKGVRPVLDSYSAFFENDRRTATGLAGYLTRAGRCGRWRCAASPPTIACVTPPSTRRGWGSAVEVLTGACRGVDVPADNVARAVAEMRAAGILIS